MKIIFPILIGLIILVSGCTTSKDYTEFAQCLTEQGVQEFGAYWCPSCEKVKVAMGDAWEKIDYIECDPKCVDSGNGLPDFCKGFESQTETCLQLGVEKLPSWIKSGQIIHTGNDLNKLSEITGCKLPE